MSPDGCTDTTSKIALPFAQKNQASLSINLQEIQWTEEHVIWHYDDEISKIQTGHTVR